MIESLFGLIFSASLIYMILGVILGLIFGAVPGLSATLAVVLLVPFTYTMSIEAGVATLIGSYVGGISGGLASAIMINMPGTPSSVATTFDGFPMAKQGKAGKALGVGVVCSFLGTLFSWICLVIFAPALSKIALSFGPFELAAAIFFGFSAVITLSGDSVYKGIISGLMGLVFCLIGSDSLTGMGRATFGSGFLNTGIAYMPALIGMFVVAEVFNGVESIADKYIVPKQKISECYMTLKELKESVGNILRSSLIGVFIGTLPGIGGSFANLVTYDQARKASKHPETFGKGNYQGIVATEAGNNATIGGALIPLIALGIPGDIVTAALLGGLMLKGVTPGPLFVLEYPDAVNAIFNSVFISSFLMLVLMLSIGVRVFPVILRVPKFLLLPVVMIMALAGTYNLNYSVNDVYTTVLMGFVGYLFDKLKISKTPLVITMILGKSFEIYLRTAITQSSGSFIPFITRPFALLFLLFTIITLCMPFIVKKIKSRKAEKSVQS